jgi:hypothetical protein
LLYEYVQSMPYAYSPLPTAFAKASSSGVSSE